MNLPVRWNMSERICEAYEKLGAQSSALHGHHHFLMTLITSGRGVQTLNGKDIPFEAGDIFILSPADFHKNTVADGETYDYLGAKFPYEILDSRLSDMCELGRFPIHLHLSETTEERIRSAFRLLVSESERKASTPDSEVLLRALIEQILILALRELPREERSPSGEFVNRTLGFLHSSFREAVTVSDAASYVGYTPNYFNTIFRGAFGVPFGVYLRNMRLSYAKNLLLSGNAPLTEIAIDAGFGSLSHFSRSFRAANGMSPIEYRKRYKPEQKE
ncbi:MAG: helix-turn-helix transcriptional regulator [Clostridia bacterium]|nr:helix-turn-helix transcriptional regulator [Clostridia bacterium]